MHNVMTLKFESTFVSLLSVGDIVNVRKGAASHRIELTRVRPPLTYFGDYLLEGDDMDRPGVVWKMHYRAQHKLKALRCF